LQQGILLPHNSLLPCRSLPQFPRLQPRVLAPVPLLMPLLIPMTT
jgi:hypothetical protein